MKKTFLSIAPILLSVLVFSQNVGIGTTTPAEKLDVSGNIKTTGEIKPNGVAGQAGQVLSSNGNGTMQWTSAKSGGNGNGGWGDCSIYNIDSLSMAVNSNGEAGDYFGFAVSISGDYAIVGAFYDSEGGFINSGSATIFKFNSVTAQWENQGKLINPNMAAGDEFGISVSISGDYAIVGAHADDEGSFIDNGSATIFKRNSSTGIWESQGKLTNPNPGNDDRYGRSVFISGDYAIVGAPTDSEGGFTRNGSATIYKRNSVTGIWQYQFKLLNPSPAQGDYFGISVSISGDYAIVGAVFDDENGKDECGSASIFKRNASTGIWESQGKLTDPYGAASDNMGRSVDIFGDYAIIGIPQNDGAYTDNGAAVIYKRNLVSGLWESQGNVYNPGGANYDRFGSSVSITGDYAMVGCSSDDENGGADNGSSTIFKRIETVWYPHQKFTSPGVTNNNINFGAAVSLHTNNRFIVGAPLIFNRGMVFFGTIK